MTLRRLWLLLREEKTAVPKDDVLLEIQQARSDVKALHEQSNAAHDAMKTRIDELLDEFKRLQDG